MRHNNELAYDMFGLIEAHKHTLHNREETDHSDTCYCICCKVQFPSFEITEHTDKGDTAICPYCNCDAVIGNASGIKMTDELLEKLNEIYF